MTQIIVHAGFHKTGTTSLQDFLHDNQEALAPYLTSYGKADFLQAGARARVYGQRPFPWRRMRFRRSFRRFLKSIPDAECIVLSRETFCGIMPGHRDLWGRPVSDQTDVAIALAKDIAKECKRRFGDDVDLSFIYTTRDRQPWLKSIYGHLLRSINLTSPFEDFAETLTDVPAPEKQAQVIANALAPIPVHIVPLELYASQLEGPAGAVLQLANVPEHILDDLKPAKQSNVAQSEELQEKFRQLNQGSHSKIRLKILKAQVLQQAAKENAP